jgi:hypothetical protein
VTRLQHRYLDRVATAATRDLATADGFAQVMGLLARPASLFTPRILAAVARTRTRSRGDVIPSDSATPARPLVTAAKLP